MRDDAIKWTCNVDRTIFRLRVTGEVANVENSPERGPIAACEFFSLNTKRKKN